jgi:hypothetical protein
MNYMSWRAGLFLFLTPSASSYCSLEAHLRSSIPPSGLCSLMLAFLVRLQFFLPTLTVSAFCFFQSAHSLDITMEYLEYLSIYRPSHLHHTQERLSRYQSGRYHPVCLGDTFKDGRYKIYHKLGWGGFSTVWLADDTEYAFRNRFLRLLSIYSKDTTNGFQSKV